MKKLMSIILAATMAFGLAVPAMAETPPEEAGAAVDTSNSGAANSGAGSQAVEIAFEVPESFTWTIPDLQNIEVHPKDQILDFCIEKTIGISDCYLGSERCVKLSITQGDFLKTPDGKTGSAMLWITMKGKAPDFICVQPTDGSIDIPFKIESDMGGEWLWSGTWKSELTFCATIDYIRNLSSVMYTNEDVQSADFVTCNEG